MQLHSVKTDTPNPKLGILKGVKYKVYDSFERRGTQFHSIVSSDGRMLNVTLGSGVIGNFKPVYRV